MVIIEKSDKTIKFEITQGSNGVKLNNMVYNGNSLKYKSLSQAGKTIERYEINFLKFNIIEGEVFGKTSDKKNFSGRLNEVLELKPQKKLQDLGPEYQQIKFCAHD